MNSNENKQYIEIIMITELKNNFLYFSHSEDDENYFNNSLIYLCKNNAEGSFGLIINKRIQIKLKDFSLQPDKELEEKLQALEDEKVKFEVGIGYTSIFLETLELHP